MSKRIIESYKKKLAAEEGYVVSRSAGLRIALCYPNTHAIGMANLGFHTLYELFNSIPDVVCEFSRLTAWGTCRIRKRAFLSCRLKHSRM